MVGLSNCQAQPSPRPVQFLPRFERRVYEVPPRISNGDGVSGAIGVGDAFVNKQGGKSGKREGTKEGRKTKGQSHMTRFF